jgi:hypothetical protein
MNNGNRLNPPKKSLIVRLASRIVAREFMRAEWSQCEMGWMKGEPMMVAKENMAQMVLATVGGYGVCVYDLIVGRFKP